MKRNFIINIFLQILLTGVIFSQIKFGAHLGLNYSGAEYTNNLFSGIEVTKKAGFAFGGLLEFKVSDLLYIQPEFNFMPKGVDLSPLPSILYGVSSGPYIVADPNAKEEVTLNFFEIPLLVKAKFGNSILKPYAFAGPSIGFIQTEEEVYSYSFDPSWNTTKKNTDSIKTDFGFMLGGGVEYDLNNEVSLFANIRYSLGISDISNIKNVSYTTRGLQFLVGITYCLSNCSNEPYTIEDKPSVPEVQKEKKIIKEYDLGKYNIPFFISGYYRPNTQNNLDEMIEFSSGKLKDCSFIEKIEKNTPKYEQNKLYAQSVENIFKTIYINSVDEIFPLFYSQAKPDEYIEIEIYGYADPRPLTGKYFDDESVIFEDLNKTSYTIIKGDDLNNLKLSGLRAWFTGKYLDKLFMESAQKGKSEYSLLKNKGRILYRYIGAEVAKDDDKLEAQRRIKIKFTKISQ